MEKEMGNVPSAGAERGKLSFAARVSYGCGDTACNVVFGMISTLLTLFYTDYVGVAAAAVGMVMLISRVFDGFSDVVMGLLVERTNSRWGNQGHGYYGWLYLMRCQQCCCLQYPIQRD